jgi:hypothetical protein
MQRASKALPRGGYYWVVEFDGPSHFLTCRLPVGGTFMKRRHLALLGYTVVSLPFWEFVWEFVADGQRRKEGVFEGQTAHFIILNDSSKECCH